METRIAIVTGASRGIGLAIAKKLHAEGYIICGLCRSAGTEEFIDWVPCDVSKPESVKEAFASVFERYGTVDVLVNNAGMGISGASEFASEEDIFRQMDVNFTGAVRCAQQVIPGMRAQKKGKIVFISSLAAIFPLPFQSFYSASKAALDCFSDALGIELRPFGIETSAVLLNDVKTEFTAARKKTAVGDDIYGGRIAASVGKMEASEQNGISPDEVANAVAEILAKKELPPRKIVGGSNVFLGLLTRILPTKSIMNILAKTYG